MTTQDLLALGNKYRTEKKYALAFEIWNEILKAEPYCTAIHINMADVFREQGNKEAELGKLLYVWNWCPFPAALEGMKPQVQARIEELQKK